MSVRVGVEMGSAPRKVTSAGPIDADLCTTAIDFRAESVRGQITSGGFHRPPSSPHPAAAVRKAKNVSAPPQRHTAIAFCCCEGGAPAIR